MTTKDSKVFEEYGQPTNGLRHRSTKDSDDIQSKGNTHVEARIQVNHVFSISQNSSESFVLNVQENDQKQWNDKY